VADADNVLALLPLRQRGRPSVAYRSSRDAPRFAIGFIKNQTKEWGHDLEARIRQWLRVAIVIAVVDGLFWMPLKHVETAAPDAAASKAGEAA
jgi:hypothetical protein